MTNLAHLSTESRNPKSQHIDRLSALEIVTLINQADQTVPTVIAHALPAIAQTSELVADTLRQGGRLIYIGAGTSGRLGILDATECPPTYSTDPEQILGLIAGGKPAVFQSVENAEDNAELGAQDLRDIHFTANDILIGIAASGRTPYVLGALEYAKTLGAHTVGIACTQPAAICDIADIAIYAVTGPEIITGSTRMKAGSAQKMILNMISTTAMILLGKVYENLMVDVKPSNAKLINRQQRIVVQATECDLQTAQETLKQADGDAKTAITMLLLNTDTTTARALLAQHHGKIANIIER